jgi:1-phosphofructokinase
VIVTVTPNPSLDLTYQLPDATGLSDPTVEVHRARSAHLEASGKGVNVSRALTLAGRPSTAVLFVGGTTGHQLLELLATERVPYRTVVQAGPTRVNTTVLIPGGPTTKVNAPGTVPSSDEIDNLVVAVDSELLTLSSEILVQPMAVDGWATDGAAGGTAGDGAAGDGMAGNRAAADDWLLICGSLPPGVDAGRLIGRLVARAHARGWKVAVDSSGAGLRAGFDAGADLLAPNEAELNAVRPGPPAVGAEAIGTAAAGVARERGCELLVSLDADGALWTDGRRILHARGPVVVPVNSAGAGDALLAGWFSAGPGTDPAVRLATAVAWGTAACLAATTVSVGGTPPSVESVLVAERLTDAFNGEPVNRETLDKRPIHSKPIDSKPVHSEPADSPGAVP